MNKNYLLMMIVVTTVGCGFYRPASAKERKYSFPFELLNHNYDQNKLVIYKRLENQKHSHIICLRDDQNNCYIVKQDKAFSLKAGFQVVFEMLSAHIACCMGISSHQVELLPVGRSFPGKVEVERPATIHTLVPGCVIKEIKEGCYRSVRFSINQGGNPQTPAKGLTEFVIKSMSRHTDLPPIVALDTFIANRDRSRSNLIYDTVNNRFYAIDMALIYDAQPDEVFIPRLACSNVTSMINNNVTFKKKHRKALHHYRDTLLNLLENFPPEKVYSLLWDFAQQSGLTKKYDERLLFDFLEKYKITIERSYSENKNLVNLLAQLLQRPHKRGVVKI